jgi:hypothetical protein
MRNAWIGVIFVVVFMYPGVAKPDSDRNFQTWFDITTIYDWERWKYNGDYGLRGIVSRSEFKLMFLRPSVLFQVKPGLTLHGGIGFFRTFFDDADDTFELRPWQGLRFVWPRIGGYVITHFLRLEERMTWETEGEKEYDFTLRARYQLGFRSPTWDVLFKNGLFLRASMEFFWNLEESLGDNFINRIRYFFGAGTHVSKTWRVELQYTLQDGRAIEDELFRDPFDSEEHILRLRLFYTFN